MQAKMKIRLHPPTLVHSTYDKSSLSAKLLRYKKSIKNYSPAFHLAHSSPEFNPRQQSDKSSKLMQWGELSRQNQKAISPSKVHFCGTSVEARMLRVKSPFKSRLQLKPLLNPQILRTCSKMKESFSTQSHTPKSQGQAERIKEYRMIRHLGEGKFGSVFLAIHRETGFIGALKILRKAEIQKVAADKKEKIKSQIASQIRIQSYLDHPNLIKLYDFFADQDHIYLFVEVGEEGHLYSLIKQAKPISEEATSIIVREITMGIQYMHSKFILHRDIKLENVVFTHGMAKICDFGWSVYSPSNLRGTLCGTPLYLSPEILKGKKYGQKVDLWALGTLTHELFTKQNPFKILSQKELSKILTDEIEMKVGSPELKSFINFILKKEPEKRPDAEIILKHPFIKKYEEIQTSEQICELSRKQKQ